MFAITERLLLRPGWAEDAPALARAIGDHKADDNQAAAKKSSAKKNAPEAAPAAAEA